MWYILTVFGLLALAFIAMPILEISLIFRVGTAFGTPATLALIVVTAVIGAALARHQGFAAVQRVQRAMHTGQELGTSMVEAAMVLAAGIMMLLPGFITDGVGIALLLPWVRRPLARAVVARVAARATSGIGASHVVFDFGDRAGPDVRHRDDDDPPPPGVIDV